MTTVIAKKSGSFNVLYDLHRAECVKIILDYHYAVLTSSSVLVVVRLV